jgi:hypothetical protein
MPAGGLCGAGLGPFDRQARRGSMPSRPIRPGAGSLSHIRVIANRGPSYSRQRGPFRLPLAPVRVACRSVQTATSLGTSSCFVARDHPESWPKGGLKASGITPRALKESVDGWPMAIIIPRH